MFTKGTAHFTDQAGFLSWYESLSWAEAEQMRNAVRETQDKFHATAITEASDEMFRLRGCYCVGGEERLWIEIRTGYAPKLRDFLFMSETYRMPLRVGEWHEDQFAFLYLGNPQEGIIVPVRFLEYVPEKDYADMSPAQVRASLSLSPSDGRMPMIPADADTLTVRAVSGQAEAYESALAKAATEMDNIKNARTGELAALQAEITKMQQELEAKKAAMMQELQERMAEMESMKESLENQIYLLDSQIYAIRCFAGETVKFAKIRSGSNAPDAVPIVIYQKLHFLDEDLGRLASIYEIQWNELRMFEDFLRHSPAALDNFVPNERCISLVRLSKDGKILSRNNDMPHRNMLAYYNYYHGQSVGILIRNGENLYLGWTDDERVHIADDLIISQIITETEPDTPPHFYSKYDEEKWQKEQKDKRKKVIDGIISRSFVYNILQGIVEHSAILPLPPGVTLGRQSEHVIYSVADKWLSDNRFGSFNDIIKRCNEKITKGDMILTVQKLVPEHNTWDGRHYFGHDKAWDNARGRGEANRTHDCVVSDCTIYPVNLIEHDKPVSMTRYRKYIEPDMWARQKNPDAKPYWRELEMTSAEFEQYRKNWPEEIVEVIEVYDYRKEHVFVSIKKTDPYRWEGYQSDARANFELYKEEYINLTYMNSTWLEYVITNKSLGAWRVNGEAVNYTYAIPYLKTALDFVRKRELTEKENLDAVDPAVSAVPDWQIRLSEWKLEKNVRELTPYQAKRFIKYLAGMCPG